jgi:hypothetical protein
MCQSQYRVDFQPARGGKKVDDEARAGSHVHAAMSFNRQDAKGEGIQPPRRQGRQGGRDSTAKTPRTPRGREFNRQDAKDAKGEGMQPPRRQGRQGGRDSTAKTPRTPRGREFNRQDAKDAKGEGIQPPRRQGRQGDWGFGEVLALGRGRPKRSMAKHDRGRGRYRSRYRKNAGWDTDMRNRVLEPCCFDSDTTWQRSLNGP